MNVQSDIRSQCSEAEWQTRVDLAACYRLVDLFGWSDLLGTHISARVPGEDDVVMLQCILPTSPTPPPPPAVQRAVPTPEIETTALWTTPPPPTEARLERS